MENGFIFSHQVLESKMLYKLSQNFSVSLVPDNIPLEIETLLFVLWSFYILNTCLCIFSSICNAYSSFHLSCLTIEVEMSFLLHSLIMNVHPLTVFYHFNIILVSHPSTGAQRLSYSLVSSNNQCIDNGI